MSSRQHVLGFLCLAAAAPAGGQSLFYPTRVTWGVAAGYSDLALELDLPRDLRIHATHRDDTMLTGDAGDTVLRHMYLGTLDLEAGLAYRPGDVNVALIAAAVVKVPIREEGRAERQQANDPRIPAFGSYIYTKVSNVGPGAALRSGLGLAAPLSARRGWWLEFQGVLDLGRWGMDFDKGWTRFGRDEAETASRARGTYIAPRFRLSVGTSQTALHIAAARTQIAFKHDDARLANHTAKGLELSVGTQFRF